MFSLRKLLVFCIVVGMVIILSTNSLACGGHFGRGGGGCSSCMGGCSSCGQSNGYSSCNSGNSCSSCNQNSCSSCNRDDNTTTSIIKPQNINNSIPIDLKLLDEEQKLAKIESMINEMHLIIAQIKKERGVIAHPVSIKIPVKMQQLK